MSDKHIGNAEGQRKAVCSAPDVCKVGNAVVPFDSFQLLDAVKKYATTVKARGELTLNVGSVIAGTMSNTGSGVMSGTSQSGGDCQIITGSPSVRIEGQPAAQHQSVVFMNNGNTCGVLLTNESPPSKPIESNQIPCNNPPKVSEELEKLLEKKALFKSSDGIKDSIEKYDRNADEWIDTTFRTPHITPDDWLSELYAPLYNSAATASDGIVRGVSQVGRSFISGTAHLGNTLYNFDSNEAINDIEILIENIRLGNICEETIYKIVGDIGEAAKEGASRLDQKIRKSQSDEIEVVVRGVGELLLFWSPSSKVNTLNKVSEGSKVAHKASDFSQGIRTLEDFNAVKKIQEARQLEAATKSTEELTSISSSPTNTLNNGVHVNQKIESAGSKEGRVADKKDNTQTETKTTEKNNNVDKQCTKGATCDGEPVNVATGDFIQQWQVISIPGLLPINLHRTYQSTSSARGLFGEKWTDEWSRFLQIHDKHIILQDSDGAHIEFNGINDEIRSRNLHVPHYLLTGHKNGELTLFDCSQQHTLHFNYINGDTRQLSAITDRHQNRLDFIYNEQHRLIAIRRSDGVFLVLEYQHERLYRIIDGNIRTRVFVECQYDEYSYLSRCHAYQQNNLWHRYSPDGLMLQWGDTDSTELTITYDDKERVIATQSTSGYWCDRFIYDDIQRMTTYIDGEGGYSRYYYNDDNLVIRAIDPLWRETHTEWKFRQKIAEINDQGERTEYGYHYNGQIAYIFLHDGRSLYYDYNDDGQLTSFTLPTGENWQLNYDLQGNLTTVTNPQGQVQTYEYSQHGELLKAIQPNGSQWQYEYNAAHQLIKSTNPYDNSTEFQFDELGRLQAYTDALNHTTRYRYSQAHAGVNGSLSELLLPDGAQQQIEYDSERRVVAVTDGEGRTTRYRYGPFDLVTSMVRPDSTAIHFEYDSLTRLKKVTSTLGETYTYERDRAGQIIRETDFTGRVLEYRYDRLGRRIATRFPDQHELRWRYAPSGVVIEQSEWLDNGIDSKCLSTTTYEYDERLQLIRATNPDSVVEFEYDAQGRLCCERINGREIQHEWDDENQTLAYTRFGERELHYAFGQLGELTQLQVNQHSPLQFSYNAVGQEYLRRSEAGFVSASHYTPTGLLAEQRAGRGTENFLNAIRDNPHQPPIYGDVQRSFHYNRAQNVVAIEDSRWQLTQYGYNANDQIIETQFSNHYESEYERFKYDANLNLIEYSTVPAEIGQPWLLLSQQQQAGRIVRRGLHQGHQDCYYDRNGRLEKKVVHKNGYRPQEWRYLWNTQNQLTACFTPEGDCWRYVYDAFGRRLSKTKTVDMLAINEKPAFPLSKKRITGWHYLWSGDQMVEETPVYADGTIAYEASIQWLYQPGAITPAARYQHGTLHYVVADHQGTPREMFTEAGMAIWGGRLHTWGKLDIWQVRYGRAEDDPNYIPCHFRFAGQYEDAETGLFYNRFRYYDKDSGQYISPDPIGLLGGFNPYGYVHNPVGWVDPFGLAGCFFAKNPKQAHAIILEKWGHNMSPAEMRELQKTIDNIKLNRPAYQRDGITFENNFRISPNSQRLDTGSGPYREWTVKTPNVGNRGTRRVVVDTKTGDAFYSHDHYDSFIKIDMSGWK